MSYHYRLYYQVHIELPQKHDSDEHKRRL